VDHEVSNLDTWDKRGIVSRHRKEKRVDGNDKGQFIYETLVGQLIGPSSREFETSVQSS
jgi:hypothetical protein